MYSKNMKHYYKDIQGWFSKPQAKLYDEEIARAFSQAEFVEVGAWKGKSTAYMAVEIINSGKFIKLNVVDTWEGSNEAAHKRDQAIINGILYEEFCANMEPVESLINTYRMTSIEASKEFNDGQLDFVFIDASHKYKDVKQDIIHWLPKVKVGGTLGGDDIKAFKGVKRAVDELFGEGNYQQRSNEWTVKNDERTKRTFNSRTR
jgi:predicted O-methyltransferase YrrM